MEMVIEWLNFQVVPELREQFIQKDAEIWTTALSEYEGFLGKEVWISPHELDVVAFVIRWSSFETWQAIPSDRLSEVETRFAEVMGQTYTLVDSKAYQVRKKL